MAYEAPKIINSDEFGQQIFGKIFDMRIVLSGQPVSDFDFVAEKTYKVRGQIALPPDFERNSLHSHRTSQGTVELRILFSEGEESWASSLLQPKKAIDSKGNEFTYSRSTIVENILVEYDKDKPTEYKVRLPKGRFTANILGKQKTFEVTNDEEQVVNLP